MFISDKRVVWQKSFKQEETLILWWCQARADIWRRLLSAKNRDFLSPDVYFSVEALLSTHIWHKPRCLDPLTVERKLHFTEESFFRWPTRKSFERDREWVLRQEQAWCEMNFFLEKNERLLLGKTERPARNTRGLLVDFQKCNWKLPGTIYHNTRDLIYF